jgi:hypothetical protein
MSSLSTPLGRELKKEPYEYIQSIFSSRIIHVREHNPKGPPPPFLNPRGCVKAMILSNLD